MAKRKTAGGGPNKSDFIRGKLEADPNAKADDIKKAWKAEGNSGELSTALFYQVRSGLGIKSTSKRGRKKGKGKGRPKKTTAAASTTTTAAKTTAAPKAKRRGRKPGSGKGSSKWLQFEQTIDKLIFMAQGEKDEVLADHLRSARRVLSKRLV